MKIKMVLTLFMLVASGKIYASAEKESFGVLGSGSLVGSKPSLFNKKMLNFDGIYMFNKKTSVVAVSIPGESLTENDLASATFDFPKGEKVHVEMISDQELGVVYKITSIVNDDENFPREILISPREFEKMQIIFDKEANVATLELEYSPYVETEVAGKSKAKRRGKKKVGSCYRQVKLYLQRTGKVKAYLPGGSAYMAAGVLPKYGFRKTGNRPSSASLGEVCVYSGGWHGHGHIEVKVRGGWY